MTRASVAGALGLVLGLAIPTSASARGTPPCNRLWDATRREIDECGPFFELLSFADVMHRPPRAPTLTPDGDGAVTAHQTTFVGFGFDTGYLFPGNLGIRAFGVRLASATRATFLGDPGGPSIAAYTEFDFAGVLYHARRGVTSWSLGLTPHLREVLAGAFNAYDYGTKPELGLTGEVRGCLGRFARACLGLTPNLYAHGTWLNGGGVGLTFEVLFLD